MKIKTKKRNRHDRKVFTDPSSLTAAPSSSAANAPSSQTPHDASVVEDTKDTEHNKAERKRKNDAAGDATRDFKRLKTEDVANIGGESIEDLSRSSSKSHKSRKDKKRSKADKKLVLSDSNAISHQGSSWAMSATVGGRFLPLDVIFSHNEKSVQIRFQWLLQMLMIMAQTFLRDNSDVAIRLHRVDFASLS